MAIKIAKKSSHRCKHGAIIVKDGKIVSRGFNRCLGVKCGLQTYHAERMALFNCEKRDLKDADLYVIRLNLKIDYDSIDLSRVRFSSVFENSKPCPKCTPMIVKCMDKYGLRKVYYS